MTRWIADDDKVIKKKGLRGVEGTPHYIVEWNVRGRRTLTAPGSNPVLGQAETVLMHRMAEAAEANQPLPPENLPDILRSTAVQIGAANQFGELYTEESDVRKLTKSFKARAAAEGVTFKKKSGQQVSLQRADSLSYDTAIAWRDKH